MLDKICRPGFEQLDQWQVQLLAIIFQKGRIGVFSELADEELRKAHFTPIKDIREAIDREEERLQRRARVAVLPEGPLTIPYLNEPNYKSGITSG